MSVSSEPSQKKLTLHILSSKTPILNRKLYIVIAIFALCILISLALFLCIQLRRKSRKRKVKHLSGLIPLVSKEIVEINAFNQKPERFTPEGKIKFKDRIKKREVAASDDSLRSSDVSIEKNIGWGRWYSLKELEAATRGFTEENVVGVGGYDVVYRDILADEVPVI